MMIKIKIYKILSNMRLKAKIQKVKVNMKKGKLIIMIIIIIKKINKNLKNNYD